MYCQYFPPIGHLPFNFIYDDFKISFFGGVKSIFLPIVVFPIVNHFLIQR